MTKLSIDLKNVAVHPVKNDKFLIVFRLNIRDVLKKSIQNPLIVKIWLHKLKGTALF